MKQHLAAHNQPGREGHQAQDGQGLNGFAGAGFTDDGDALPLMHLVGEIVYRPEFSAVGIEIGFEMLHLKNRLCHSFSSSLWNLAFLQSSAEHTAAVMCFAGHFRNRDSGPRLAKGGALGNDGWVQLIP